MVDLTTPPSPPPPPPTEQPLGRRKRLKGLHINRMIPNALTLLAICAGLSAIRYAFEDKWEYAAVAILVAAILDGLDGRVARILKGASKFGAELDSLSDFISFGVAPAIMLYLWAMQGANRFGWMLAMLFAVCMALRLARFNTALEDVNQPTWSRNFFTGVPAPAGAGLVLLPMILSFQVGDTFVREPVVVAIFLLVVAGLLVSAIPTFSFKKVKIEQHWVLPAMLLVGLLAAGLVSAPWLTLSTILGLYLVSIPFSVRAHREFRKRDANGQA
ncbi:MAG: CDP-diacylglycerol--serine O-phosphatidyltransferase [Hyphomicrobiales bacterium]|nr:CDP-diacylglycerol--serine O-phosphatidyltransferase [Hyphomicrobiales bacterium]